MNLILENIKKYLDNKEYLWINSNDNENINLIKLFNIDLF